MEYPTSHMYFPVYTQGFRHFQGHRINVKYLLQWNPDFSYLQFFAVFIIFACQKRLVENLHLILQMSQFMEPI